MAYHVRIVHTPETSEELADLLRRAALHDRLVEICGNRTKHLMAGPVLPADEVIATTRLNQVLQYEPCDLTVSVQAGMKWSDFRDLLARQKQMVALDPPFAEQATVGGVVAANSSGPRRLLYGTARDVVIGMEFATAEGKLVRSGGNVVKNVAGLDMAKLMIGSFGTLAALTVVNFKVAPAPEAERSFLLPFEDSAGALAARDRILGGPLQPAALDMLNPGAAETMGKRSWVLAVRAGGNPEAMARYERDLAAFKDGVAFDDDRQDRLLWRHIQEFTPQFMAVHPHGAVVRASCTLKGLQQVVDSLDGPAVIRAGSGVCYGYFEQADQAGAWLGRAAGQGWKAVIEFSPEEWKPGVELWPSPGADFVLMQRIKQLFDPGNVLNRGRLYGRI
jgi:glycolate oxidase FAD binding subunit